MLRVCVLFVGLAIAVGVGLAAVPVQERQYLVDLFKATNGTGWNNNTGWLHGDPCDDRWFGLKCDDNHTHVTRLLIGKNDLAGTLPEGIEVLAELNYIWLSGQRLTGPIPAGIGALTKMTGIQLSLNAFTGPLPDLGNLTQVFNIDMDNNQLSGPLPASWSGMSSIGTLSVSDNQLTGTVPDSWKQLTTMTLLDLSYNQLKGAIPAWLGSLPITFLWLSHNDFSGGIPQAFTNLTNIDDLWLDDLPGLTGDFPDGLIPIIANISKGAIDPAVLQLQCTQVAISAALKSMCAAHEGWCVLTSAKCPSDVDDDDSNDATAVAASAARRVMKQRRLQAATAAAW